MEDGKVEALNDGFLHIGAARTRPAFDAVVIAHISVESVELERYAAISFQPKWEDGLFDWGSGSAAKLALCWKSAGVSDRAWSKSMMSRGS